MSLLKKLFRGQDAAPASTMLMSQFQDDDGADEQDARNASRRDMLQVVLRDTMRQHGIPSNWIECRTMFVTTRGTGMHVQLIVRQGHDRLLTYIPAFQSGFLVGVEKFEPRAAEWLLSLSWQFEGMSSQNYVTLPDPVAAASVPSAAAAAVLSEEDEVQEDLRALMKIRNAALQEPVESASDADNQGFDDTRPGR